MGIKTIQRNITLLVVIIFLISFGLLGFWRTFYTESMIHNGFNAIARQGAKETKNKIESAFTTFSMTQSEVKSCIEDEAYNKYKGQLYMCCNDGESNFSLYLNKSINLILILFTSVETVSSNVVGDNGYIIWSSDTSSIGTFNSDLTELFNERRYSYVMQHDNLRVFVAYKPIEISYLGYKNTIGYFIIIYRSTVRDMIVVEYMVYMIIVFLAAIILFISIGYTVKKWLQQLN